MIRDAMLELHVGHPAVVVAFDRNGASVDVQPQLLETLYNDDGQELPPTALPVIQRVPVAYPGGAGWRLTFPIAPGDVVHLAFADRSLDAWKSASAGTLVDPAEARHHDLSDAIAIPSLSTRSAAPASLDASALRLGREDGTCQLELAPDGRITLVGGDIRLGAPSASRGVARTGDEVTIPAGAILVQVGAETGSNPGPVTGTITGGSRTVKAVD
jgi:hypothetical protein